MVNPIPSIWDAELRIERPFGENIHYALIWIVPAVATRR